MDNYRLSVVIVNWNTCDLLRNCLHSLHRGQELACEVIVVDNGSSDDSVAMIRTEFPEVRLIANAENRGFAVANNQGIRVSAGEYIMLLNSDTIVKPGALRGLVYFLDEHPQAGAVGPRLVRPDGTAQPYAFGGDPTLTYLLTRGLNQLLFRRYLHNWATDATQEVDWVSGACLVVRRRAIDQVGLLDENIFMYFEDNDWCLRIRKGGWKVYLYPEVEVIHLGGCSLSQNPAARAAYGRSLLYFYRKHYSKPARWLVHGLLPVYQRIR